MAHGKHGYQPVRVELFKQHISVRQAAEDLGVSPAHLRAVVCGRTYPMNVLREKLPTYLGVSLEELFTPSLLAKEYDPSRVKA